MFIKKRLYTVWGPGPLSSVNRSTPGGGASVRVRKSDFGFSRDYQKLFFLKSALSKKTMLPWRAGMHFDTFPFPKWMYRSATFYRRCWVEVKYFFGRSARYFDPYVFISKWMNRCESGTKNSKKIEVNLSIHSLWQKPHFFKPCTSILLFHIDAALRLTMHFDTLPSGCIEGNGSKCNFGRSA